MAYLVGRSKFIPVYLYTATHLHSDQCFYNALTELAELYLEIGVME